LKIRKLRVLSLCCCIINPYKWMLSVFAHRTPCLYILCSSLQYLVDAFIDYVNLRALNNCITLSSPVPLICICCFQGTCSFLFAVFVALHSKFVY